MEAVMPSISSHYDSEEKTEPFNSSEYLRLLAERQKRQQQLLQQQEQKDEATAPNSPNALGTTISNIPLDDLVVPSDRDIRLLVRPLTSRPVSPGRQESCEWVALRTERSSAAGAGAGSDSDESEYTPAAVETVLAVTQTSKDIKFTVRMPSEPHSEGTPCPLLWCELYYDTTSDNQNLVNLCEMPISLSRIYLSGSPKMSSSLSLSSLSPPSSSDGTPVPPGTPVQDEIEHTINPGTTRALSPGTWRIKMDGIEVLDFRILERRRPVYKALPAPPTDSLATTLSGKRSFSLVVEDDDDDSEAPEARRRKIAGSDADGDSDTPVSPNSKESAVQFLRPTAEPFTFPLPKHSHTLLDMQPRDSVILRGSNGVDNYAVTRHDTIASTSLSTVFTGRVDGHPGVPSGSVVTVKVIKTSPYPPQRSPSPADRQGRAVAVPVPAGELNAQDQGRWAVQQANIWQREVDQHGGLQHNSIVRLYAADARCLSLYMEHIDARDIGRCPAWRHPETENFVGDRADATRILRDISGALNYVHDLKVVHNDIKPGNILYSRERGAVLCDFGLSSKSSAQPSPGGTPYYLPPEYIALKKRGPPGDVWALGITMLYVLGKIAYPDSRGSRRRPNPLYWQIAEVNDIKPKALMPPAPRIGPHSAHSAQPNSTYALPAVEQMRMWLAEVSKAKETLNRGNNVERLTYDMLTPSRNQRITMREVAQELYAEG